MKQLHMKTAKLILLATPRRRRGVTLMEVLMSVMIMGIGVVSLASLFPISVLRGVQATKLTNSTVLRYNAEALIDAFPQHFVFDPDGILNTNGHIAHQRQNRNYIVDPLGSYYATTDSTGLEGSFGNDGLGSSVTRIPRFHAGLTSQLGALNFFSQQDSWTLLYDGIPSSINGARDTITIDPDDITSGSINLTEISQTVTPATGSLAGGRLLLYDVTGKQVQVRNINGASINTSTGEISFTNPLPDNELYDNIAKIRIEIFDQRYSYLLTVRRQIASDVASVDVVVFFRRNFDPEFEAVHDVENFVAEWLPGDDGAWGFAGVDDDGDKDDGGNTDEYAGEAGWPGSDDYRRREFRLHFNTDVEKPLVKKGGYVFDSINARWYRIQKIENDSSATVDLTLDQPIIQSINDPDDPTALVTGMIVMPNIVQVYPLGNKSR
ncbi:MAG: prepilin-type N-terminal cleavage/methylation domain-containing protein [Gimesia sp.]